jgi:hypothetical protein
MQILRWIFSKTLTDYQFFLPGFTLSWWPVGTLALGSTLLYHVGAYLTRVDCSAPSISSELDILIENECDMSSFFK